jgi:DNA mismatch repair protein MutL
VFGTYWIVEKDGSMLLIDQHAAHERVLYETFTRSYKDRDVVSQRLVSPMSLQLDEPSLAAVTENVGMLRSLGFEIEDFGGGCVSLSAVPNIFNAPADTRLFTDIVDALRGEPSDVYDARAGKVATAACKAAVKGNNRLSITEARELIDRLMTLENPFNCPHGRPTVVEVTKYEVEKMFMRVV